MSLVEVVCDVSSIIVIFGPAPNSRFSGQHFGMEGPMQLSPVCHIAIPPTWDRRAWRWAFGRQTAGRHWCCALWKLGGSVDVDWLQLMVSKPILPSYSSLPFEPHILQGVEECQDMTGSWTDWTDLIVVRHPSLLQLEASQCNVKLSARTPGPLCSRSDESLFRSRFCFLHTAPLEHSKLQVSVDIFVLKSQFFGTKQNIAAPICQHSIHRPFLKLCN